jgi:hypothetical protein
MILNKQEEGQSQLVVLYPGVEIFQASQREWLFQKFHSKVIKTHIMSLRNYELDWNIWDQKREGIIPGVKRFLLRIIYSQPLDNLIMVTVIFNTVAMMMNGLSFTNSIQAEMDM